MNKKGVVWLYGSYARNEDDFYSDVDLLIISDQSIRCCEIVKLPNNIPRDKVSESHYTLGEMKKMSSYGSLFLHHLKKEGVFLGGDSQIENELRKILENLVPYQRVSLDVRGFNIVINDIEDSILNNGSIKYELSVLGTILRHSSILGCYLLGVPKFGRIEPVKYFIEQLGLSNSIGEKFGDLYKYKLPEIRDTINNSHHTVDYAYEWCSIARKITGKLEELSYK